MQTTLNAVNTLKERMDYFDANLAHTVGQIAALENVR
jgi:hypothetical protein